MSPSASLRHFVQQLQDAVEELILERDQAILRANQARKEVKVLRAVLRKTLDTKDAEIERLKAEIERLKAAFQCEGPLGPADIGMAQVEPAGESSIAWIANVANHAEEGKLWVEQ